MLKLYVRNDGDQYVGIRPSTSQLIDTVLIRPGDARELIFPDVDTAPDLVTVSLDQEQLDEIRLLQYPPAEPQPDEPPPAGPVVVNVQMFSATATSVATVSLADAAKVNVGDTLTLTQTGGVADTIQADTATEVTAKVDSELTTTLDLSAADVTDLTATAIVTP